MNYMQEDRTPSFLNTFIGSLYNFGKYPEYAKRSVGSMLGHYVLLIVICCGLYAAVTQSWTSTYINPVLDEMAEQVPAITITDGKASVDIEQPYVLEIEGEVLGIIDTTQPADVYLEEYDAIILLSEDRFIVKEDTGKVESYELPDSFALSSSEVKDWIDRAQTWVFPSIFLICFFWQVCWKAIQVLIVAAVITLVQSSRPDFTTHWKLANLALVPAMLFGVIVYTLFLTSGFGSPGAGFVFWGILAGLTYMGSEKLKKSPHHS